MTGTYPREDTSTTCTGSVWPNWLYNKIRRASRYLPQNVRRLLYQAVVLLHVDYCSIVWNHCDVMLRDRMERIQKYTLRIIHGKPPRASSEPLLKALGWTTLEKDGTN